MKKIMILFAVTALVFTSCNKESEVEGCTDTSATNYNVDATMNDGSCAYAIVDTTPTITEYDVKVFVVDFVDFTFDSPDVKFTIEQDGSGVINEVITDYLNPIGQSNSTTFSNPTNYKVLTIPLVEGGNYQIKLYDGGTELLNTYFSVFEGIGETTGGFDNAGVITFDFIGTLDSEFYVEIRV